MKTFYPKIKAFKSGLILLLALCGIIYGCRKDHVNQTSGQHSLTIIDAKIPQLKELYANSIKAHTKAIQSTDKWYNELINSLEVDWDSYTLQKTNDSSIVAEFEMKNDSGLYTLKQLDNKYKNKTTVVFIERKDGSRISFFAKAIEDLTIPGSSSVIDQLHYRDVPGSFTGMIFYYTLERQFVNGESYVNGARMGSASFNETTTGGVKINSVGVNNAAAPCTITDIYSFNCQKLPSGELIDCRYKYIGTINTCNNDDGEGYVGGGDGGSAGTPPTEPPCIPAKPSVKAMEVVKNGKLIIQSMPAPGTGGGGTTPTPKPCPTTPVPPVGVKDSVKLKNDLADALDANPNLLIKCSEVEKFKALVNTKPPQSVYDRISNLNDNTSNKPLFSNPYFVQQIKNAYGPQINLDRFEININSLPVVNGQRLTAPQFLNYIRLNINSFIDNNITTFQPYIDPTNKINDASIWNSNTPLGAILHLKISADDGSVIVQDAATDHWTVATLRTPLDGSHPVSGNRSWGYTVNANGGYTYYVTGADRLTTGRQEIAQYLFGIPFAGGDNLWTSFQQKLTAFTNSHNGAAIVGNAVKNRPDYYSLSQYFNGKITLAQLKAMNACQ